MSGVRTAVPLAALAVLVAAGPPRGRRWPGAALRSRTAIQWRGSAGPRAAEGRVAVPRRVVVLGAVAAAGGLAWLLRPAAAVAGVLVVVAVARGRAAARAARAADGVRAAAAEAVSVMAAELRAGRTPVAALDAAAGGPWAIGPWAIGPRAIGPRAIGPPEVHRTVATAAAVARLGGDVPAVLRDQPLHDAPEDLRATPELRPLRRLGVAWQVSEVSGAALADVLDRVEDDVRAAARERTRLATELAGTRMTVRLLAGLPMLGIALASALGARPAHVLLDTPVGGWCLVAGAAFECAGLAWADRIVARAHRRLP